MKAGEWEEGANSVVIVNKKNFFKKDMKKEKKRSHWKKTQISKF